MIFHHMRSLSEEERVQHVFLVGRHDAKKYAHFIDDLLTEFSFKTIQFVTDDVPRNEAGVLFKHKDRLTQDNPDYLLVMRYNVCSSFPLHELIAAHTQRESDIGCEDEYDDEDLNEGPCNKALVTVMAARGSSQRGVFAIDEATQEVLHYTEAPEEARSMVKAGVQPPANCGVYLFSTRVY